MASPYPLPEFLREESRREEDGHMKGRGGDVRASRVSRAGRSRSILLQSHCELSPSARVSERLVPRWWRQLGRLWTFRRERLREKWVPGVGLEFLPTALPD